MNYHLAKFESFHAQVMAQVYGIREFDGKILEQPGMMERLEVYSSAGPCYTLIVDEQMVASAGMVIHWPGMAELWAITTPLVEDYPLTFHRVVRDGLDKQITEHGLHRVECTVLTNHKVSVKWLTKMGFDIEGIRRKYDPYKNDYFLMAKVI